jgi:uncharacterized protein YbjT (DUF2867 family)
MKIVVIGGTGLIGSKLVNRLRRLEHEVIAASPASGVNTLTGEGLDDAFKGAQVVVDLANSPTFEDDVAMNFFQTAGRNIFAAEAKAGVQHHVALSVVGTDRLQASGYFRAKLAQEKLIRESGIPYSIVHSTQFFEFMPAIIKSAAIGNEIHIPPAAFQPIAADDVAEAMKDVTIGTPLNAMTEIAGPERMAQDEFVGYYMKATNDQRKLVRDVHALYFGLELNDQSLVPGENPRLGKIKFKDWVKAQVQAAVPA